MKLKVIEKKVEAKGTKSFFCKPEKSVSYFPGQYYYVTLPLLLYPDARGNTRHFTLSSSPTEKNFIRFTTRIRQESGFKRTLDELKVGDEIEGEGPNGTFVLDETEKSLNHVFLAGGIGITPFRSFIKYAIDKNLDKKYYLIYSCSAPDEIAFKDELRKWEQDWHGLKVALTVSQPEYSKEKWTGLKGRIDEKLIRSQLRKWGLEISNPIFWFCGPPAMADAMEEILRKMKIKSDKLRSEKFSGY